MTSHLGDGGFILPDPHYLGICLGRPRWTTSYFCIRTPWLCLCSQPLFTIIAPPPLKVYSMCDWQANRGGGHCRICTAPYPLQLCRYVENDFGGRGIEAL